jgi:predicted DCC family thiol-disulfide oxidoreductase YuxK
VTSGKSVQRLPARWFPAERSRSLAACYAFSGVPPTEQATEYIFYDGHCGLCHRVVQFVLRHDRSGSAFRFAPLQGETFQARVPVDRREGLPDTFVVLARDASLLARSSAFIHILRQLGGGWKTLGAVLSVIPRGMRDLVYDFVARIRYRVFGRREDLCPMVPAELRERFDP